MSVKRIKVRKKKEERAQVVGQWIEVEVIDGVTVSTRYPPDDELRSLIIEKEAATGRPVDLVYRRMFFSSGVPPEYEWTTNDPVRRQYGGLSTQRLRVADWLEISGRENGGHLKGSLFTMPRPESRGGCDCPACINHAARLAKYGP